jgi:hypothetical protein
VGKTIKRRSNCIYRASNRPNKFVAGLTNAVSEFCTRPANASIATQGSTHGLIKRET